jgi:Amino acid transporters
MMFAFARDGGLPGSKWLRKVNAAHRTPGAAIWTSAVLAIVVTLYGDAFTVLSAGSACSCSFRTPCRLRPAFSPRAVRGKKRARSS